MSTLVHHEEVTLDERGETKVSISPSNLYDVRRARAVLLDVNAIDGPEGVGELAELGIGRVALFRGVGPDGLPKGGASISGGVPGETVTVNVYQD